MSSLLPADIPALSDEGMTRTSSGTLTPGVLFVDQSGQLGGAELSLLPLAASWSAPCEVLLLSDGPFRERLTARGVHVMLASDARVSGIRKKAAGVKLIAALPAIVRQVRAVAKEARRFDVLFLNTQKALVLGTLGKPLHRKPIVWHLHDIMSQGHFGRVQRLVVKWLVRLGVDQVVANSSASASALAELVKRPVASLPVVHNGVDVSEYQRVGEGDLPALRHSLGLPENGYLVGLFGRLAPWKGQHVAIQALACLPDVHLVLVGSALFGEDEYAASLHTLAARLGVEERVHFAGFRHDVPDWMHAMDLIVHTSTEAEPFGRVIIEGMAARKPVIASDAGGVKEIVRHGENGWLIPPGHPALLAEAISVLRCAPDLAQTLAARAQADAAQRFSVEAYLARMKTVIEATSR